MDVQSIDSDFLKSGNGYDGYGDNDNMDGHDVPNLSKSHRGAPATTKNFKEYYYDSDKEIQESEIKRWKYTFSPPNSPSLPPSPRSGQA